MEIISLELIKEINEGVGDTKHLLDGVLEAVNPLSDGGSSITEEEKFAILGRLQAIKKRVSKIENTLTNACEYPFKL